MQPDPRRRIAAPAAEHDGAVELDNAVDSAEIERLVSSYLDELIAFRRDLHAHPEPGREEIRTTGRILDRLTRAGLEGRTLPCGTGLTFDIGDPGSDLGSVALRADIDALRVSDEKDVPYRSTRPGLCHACGHDVHTAIVVGAGLVLRDLQLAGRLDHGVRLIFQPAEEQIPGGALDVISAGGTDGVGRIFALHCDPRLEVGQVGLRTGAITSAADRVRIVLRGPGGHTARPHRSADLVHALAALVSQLPAVLSRKVDPRAGLSVVWGRISAGDAANAIPMTGEAEGTVRCLDVDVWEESAELLPRLAREIVAPFGVRLEADVHRGVPPVVNEAAATELLEESARLLLGQEAIASTDQSLGGEDFAWYLTKASGSMARLGVRPVGAGAYDIHQGTFDVDENCIGVGIRLLVGAALAAGAEQRLH